jgi:DNA-directed RNA polymerase subunit beta'
MPKIRTLGQILVNDAIPEDMRDDARVFNKKNSNAFFEELAHKHPDKYVDVLKSLTDISRVAGTEYGNQASISLRDLKIPPRIKEYRKGIQTRIQAVAQNPNLSREQKNDKIVSIMRKAMPNIQKNLESEVFERDNAFGEQIKHGLRGSPVQLTQLLFGDMLVADHKGNPLPIPGLHGYGEGVTPAEFWAGTYGSRKGYSDVQFATAQTGFLGKQIAMMAQRLKVTGDDCGAEHLGIEADGNDSEVIGAVLARDTGPLKAGRVISKADLPHLRDEKILVRSHVTCQQKQGVCKQCSGKRDQGEFPPMNSYVGINSARVVAEPMTQQLGLSAKHLGGVVGLNDDNVAGFDEINQFLQVPKNFKGAAVLAPFDGKVRKIYDAPQGGQYVQLDSESLYVPPSRSIDVKVGDSMEAGDVLTDGTPNPGELVKYKGLGQGRQYFTDKFYDILKSNGVPTHRRNVETLSRAFFDKVRITKPEGFQGYTVGDIVSYSDIQRDYQARQGALPIAPKRAVGSFLEQPVLNYTIGTRITPSVAKRLADYNIDKVITHKDEPPFSPEVIRLMAMSSKDKDWKVQMSGFGLKKSFLESARKGSKSNKQNTSYVGSLMDPSRLGKEACDEDTRATIGSLLSAYFENRSGM